MMLYLTTVPSLTPLNINNIVATTKVVSKTTGMFLRTTRSEGGGAAINLESSSNLIQGKTV